MFYYIIFLLYFDYFSILVFSRFGSERWIRVLIASVIDLCILFTLVNGFKSYIVLMCYGHTTHYMSHRVLPIPDCFQASLPEAQYICPCTD